MWIALNVGGGKLAKSRFFRTTEFKGFIEYVNNSSCMVDRGFGRLALIPVFLNEVLKSANRALILRLVAQTVRSPKV